MRERRFEDYYVGQEVWSPMFGNGIVSEIYGREWVYPIECIFGAKKTTFTLNGHYEKNDSEISLFFKEDIKK